MVYPQVLWICKNSVNRRYFYLFIGIYIVKLFVVIIMELLNEKVIDSNSFQLLQLMIKKLYVKENNPEFIISYNEFKEKLLPLLK